MENTKKATFYLNQQTLKALKYKAVTEGKTISELVDQLLHQNIEPSYILLAEQRNQSEL